MQTKRKEKFQKRNEKLLRKISVLLFIKMSVLLLRNIALLNYNYNACLRPYHDEHTHSHLITDVKHRRAEIVLGWGTKWEYLCHRNFIVLYY